MKSLPVVRTCGECMHWVTPSVHIPGNRRCELKSVYFYRYMPGCRHFNAQTGLRWVLLSDSGRWFLIRKPNTYLGHIFAWGNGVLGYGVRFKLEQDHSEYSARDAARALIARALADESRGGK